jgi:ectoine hydroxylase-related dioxygenase (phytanoyl-CoA dioxygenase family)
MATVRIHLDAVDTDNAPLLIASGSHQCGLIRERDVGEIVGASEIYSCDAEPGDVWLYATAILHASDRAVRPTRRKVLQVDYSATDLPKPLEWLLD